MHDEQLFLLFLGIIAMCMVTITAIIVFFAIQYAKTTYKLNAFIAFIQKIISTFSSNLSVIAFKAFTQLIKKNPEIKEDNMKRDNLISFTLGAAITGISAYYIFKNKDEISKKINSLEETFIDDYEDLLYKAKEKFEDLSKAFQSSTQEFIHSQTVDEIKNNEIRQLVKKFDKLQKEIESLGI